MAPLAPDAKLEGDLNLSSMDRVELMSALEDRYQVDLNEANFTKVSTVGDLERLLREPQKSPQSGYRYPRWAQRWPVTWIRNFIYYLLTWPATMIMAHPKIVGRENLRGVDGPLLISCNHVTYIDVGFALIALPPRLRRKLAVGMWGEMLWEMWRPPADLEPVPAPVLQSGILPGRRAVQRFSAAAAVGRARKLRLCRRIGGSRLQRAGLSRRRAHAGWQAVRRFALASACWRRG